MSSPYAIAAITALLKSHLENWLIDQGIGADLGADVLVSALPPDRMRTGADEQLQINLFLYMMTPNTGIRRATLPFDLHYLVTAYGSADTQHEVLLGVVIAAMRGLALDAAALRAALTALSARDHGGIWAAALKADVLGPHEQLTATPHFLSAEESSRIWSALQARYRPSLAYRLVSGPAERAAQ